MLESQSEQTSLTQGIYVSLKELLDIRYELKGLNLFSANNRRSPLVGSHHSKLRGRGIDFDQVRNYLPGDDIRSIDWRVTARTGQAHTKIFYEEKERPVFILVEQSKQLFLGTNYSLKSVVAAQLASLLGWAALESNDRIGGLVFNEDQQLTVRPRLSKRSLLQFINYIHKMNTHLDAKSPLRENNFLLPALKQAKEVLRPGSLLFLIIDERSLDLATEQVIKHLSIHLDIVLLPIYDPIDRKLPKAGLLRFAQDNQEIVIDTNNTKLRNAYAELAKIRQQNWQALAKKISAKLLAINTGESVIDQIQPLLTMQNWG